MTELSGRIAVVTGGGSGMGRAMAIEFARLGAAVVVAGRRPEPLAETVALVEAAGGRDRKSTRLNSSHSDRSRMPSSA